MPTSNETILDSFIRHQTYLLRYAGGLRNELLPGIIGTEEALFNVIVKWAERTQRIAPDLTGSDAVKLQTSLTTMLKDLRAPVWSVAYREALKQFETLIVQEAAYGARVIEGAVPVILDLQLPPAHQLRSVVKSKPFQGYNLKQWFKSIEQSDINRLEKAAKIGIISGQTPTQIARGIVGTQKAGYMDGQARKALKDMETVLLTATNSMQNEAKQQLYAQNSDIIAYERFVATLDSRTTLICIGASSDNSEKKGDGVYKRGEAPKPPLHPRCRSLVVPWINPANVLTRPFDARVEKTMLRDFAKENELKGIKSFTDLPWRFKGKYRIYKKKQGEKLIGQIPATQGWNEFLKNQGEEFQNEILGKARAEAFRKGEITLDKFVSDNNNVLTLKELEEKGYEI